MSEELTVEEACKRINSMNVPEEYKPLFSAFLSERTGLYQTISDQKAEIKMLDDELEKYKSQLRIFVELYELRKQVQELTDTHDSWYNDV